MRGWSEENRRRGKGEAEFELADTGVFDENRYFDVTAEYAKASPDDILIRITVANRGPEAATLHLLPTLWFRNTWSWGCTHEGCEVKPRIEADGCGGVIARHATLGAFRMFADVDPNGASPQAAVYRERNEFRAALRNRQRHAAHERRVSRLRRSTAGQKP